MAQLTLQLKLADFGRPTHGRTPETPTGSPPKATLVAGDSGKARGAGVSTHKPVHTLSCAYCLRGVPI